MEKAHSSKTYRPYDQKLENEIWDILLKSLIQEYCFDIHRTIKLKCLFLEPDLDPDCDSKKLIGIENRVNQKELEAIVINKFTCPICKKFGNAVGFKNHLHKCLGGGRASYQKAREMMKRKVRNDVEIEPTVSTGRKKAKKVSQPKPKTPKPKKTSGRKPKENSKLFLQVNPFESMTYEERKAFLQKKCGAITKSYKKCSNSLKCPQHSEDERQYVRQTYLSNVENLASNDQTDATHEGSF